MILLFLWWHKNLRTSQFWVFRKKETSACPNFGNTYIACTINHPGKLICLCACLHKHNCAGLIDKPEGYYPPPPELFELSKWKVISQTNPLYSFFLKWCWGWGWEGGGVWNLLWMMQWTFIDKKIQTNLTKNLVLIQETLPSSQHRRTSWIFNAVNFLAFLTAY